MKPSWSRVERDPVVASVWQWLIDPATTPDVVRALPLVEQGDDLRCEPFTLLHPGARALIGFKLQQGSTRPGNVLPKWSGVMRGGSAGVDADKCQYWGAPMRERVAQQVRAIKHWRIVQGSYIDCAWDFPATWFVDPPYQTPGSHYVFGAATLDFVHLRAWCEARRGQMIVCEQQGATWAPFEPFARIKAAAGKQRKRTLDADGHYTSAEVIWAFDR